MANKHSNIHKIANNIELLYISKYYCYCKYRGLKENKTSHRLHKYTNSEINRIFLPGNRRYLACTVSTNVYSQWLNIFEKYHDYTTSNCSGIITLIYIYIKTEDYRPVTQGTNTLQSVGNYFVNE